MRRIIMLSLLSGFFISKEEEELQILKVENRELKKKIFENWHDKLYIIILILIELTK
jgi:hypothetical protein